MFEKNDIVIYDYDKYIVKGFNDDIDGIYIMDETTKQILLVDISAVKHLDRRPYQQATKKQLNAIKFIESYTDYKFEGETIQDLSDFLSKYLTLAKDIRDEEYIAYMETDANLGW